MTEKNHVFLTEVVSGICPSCTCRTMLVGFSSTFYRCTTCGNELEQKVNGVITYIPITSADGGSKVSLGHGAKDHG